MGEMDGKIESRRKIQQKNGVKWENITGSHTETYQLLPPTIATTDVVDLNPVLWLQLHELIH